ncbi:M20/M25/M40 family metallo-hydrolase [Noviherbaspirillum pedocola]|uniref:M20/M25/M40 family metallo-hydrolase n=1 Tax=Noviherbaspirillum pedocola TaxID=2801341 RepID=A0A934STV7_9BURK|nr:M20/M25/M40 family metallo-hydrolase [Noviherbaspirillum pedocola]MBK4735439.1 M20/M25/M40 family metallo-hydrolase [Noviherbaspirillum pedocola]
MTLPTASLARFSRLVRTLPALLAAGVLVSAHAGQPDDKLLGAARAAQPALIASLKDMVMIESGSNDAAGLAKMAAYTEKRLQALGAQTETRKAGEGPGSIVIGRFTGTGKGRIMLIAHMDTVYREGVLQTQPWRIEGNRIYGPGIADDKGGIAVILHALQILNDAGWRDYAKITVLFNSDEETGSRGSGELIATLAAEHDEVLSCEPSSAAPESLLLGASGTGTVHLKVHGKSAHAGVNPQLGRNALIELSHQLLQTEDVAKSVPGTQLNWTLSRAGSVVNQIPENASAEGDMRLTAPDGFDRMETALAQRIKNRRVPDTETTVTIDRGRPPFLGNAASRALAQQGQAIYAELDRPLTLVDMIGGATDAGFAARSGKATVLESFGLPGAGYHARDEYIVTDGIVPRLYLMTRMLQELGKR